MILPDYQGGSILNLMASIEAACGGHPRYEALHALPPSELAAARNLILLVIDGLGHAHLTGACPGGALNRHLRAKITSVFPSTTATAVTTFLTALAPQQHGLTGWFTYFREIGSIAAVLPFQPRHGGRSYHEAGIAVGTLFGPAPIFDRIAIPSHAISPQWIVHSDFNTAFCGRAQRRGYRILEEMFGAIAEIALASPERKYIYAYFPGLDSLAHQYGIGSRRATGLLAKLDQGFAQLMAALEGSGSTIIATADHGMVDGGADSIIELDDHPSLAESLILPLCGEPRVAYCYVHPDKAVQFENAASEELSGRARLFKSRELVEAGWFGPGQPHPRLLERVGHYTLVMEENYSIKDWLIGERRYNQIGVHGGVSAAEMEVPLIVAEA